MDINHSEFGYVVMVRDRGQDEPRRLPKIYPDHPSAVGVTHNLFATGRYNSVWIREATKDDPDMTED